MRNLSYFLKLLTVLELKLEQQNIGFCPFFPDDMPFDGRQPLLPLKTAVFHDTLLVLAEAVRLMDYNSIMAATEVSCLEEKSWESGATFFNYINSVDTTGITGRIRFQV